MLKNTAYRLQHEKKLTVGFFGGSITEGTGASSLHQTSWRANITRYLKETYPEAEITAVNAAVGGTGTDLGLFRLGHDLLQYHPNLVFIEFATNDSENPRDEQFKCYESCLRQILTKDPTTEIVCVFTITKYIEEKLLTFGDFDSRTAQTILAYHYGLDMVNLGEHLRMAVAKNGGDWMKYTIDNVHPNDDGYLVMTEAMKNALVRLLAETPDALQEKAVPAPYCEESVIPYGDLVEMRDIIGGVDGWTFVDKPFKWRFPHYVSADGIGSELTYEFEGRDFGIYHVADNESGILEMTLDGKETKLVCLWDEACKGYSRGSYKIPFKNLEKGRHTVKLRVSEQKHAESLGNKCSIFALLVSNY